MREPHEIVQWRPRANALARAAVLAGLTLLDPVKLSGWRRGLYTAAVAGCAAWVTWDELGVQRPEYLTFGLGEPAARGGIACGVAGLVTATMPMGIKADAYGMALLRKWRIPAPRLWMAAAAFAISLWSERKQGVEDGSGDAESVETRELDQGIRRIAEKILAATDDWGAPPLREQLKTAQRGAPFDTPDAWLVVAEDVPVTAAGYYTFPYMGRYSVGGVDVDITVLLSEGRLVGIGRDGVNGEVPLAWPDESEVTVTDFIPAQP